MPNFATFVSTQPRPYGNQTIVIDSQEQVEQFFQDIIVNNKNYENIYVADEMAEYLKNNAHHLPEAYREAFQTKYGGFIGFAVSMEHSLHSVASVGYTAEGPVNDTSAAYGEVDATDDIALNYMADSFGWDEPVLSLQTAEGREANNPPTGDDDNDDFIGFQANSNSPILTARARTAVSEQPESPEFNYLPEIDMVQYNSLFDNDPFKMLANCIRYKNDEVLDLPGHGRTYHFKRHLDNILPIVAFAVAGARQDYKTTEEGRDPLEDEKLLSKLQALEEIQGLLQSLRAHANNKSRYSEDYFETKVTNIIDKLNSKDMNMGDLEHVLREVAGSHLSNHKESNYQHKKGSTVFDASVEELNISGHKKRVKIEHKIDADSNTNVVTGKFSYSRKAVIGVQSGHFSGVKKIFAQRKEQRQEMHAQVADFVTVALNDYNKGSEGNPIYLQPSNGNQSELSLAILLEFKKQAMLQGKSFWASNDNGERFKITPNAGFGSDLEKNYFNHFAMQTPKVRVGRGKLPAEAEQCAGYQLLKEVKVAGNSLKDHKDFEENAEDYLNTAMTTYLKDAVNTHLKEQAKNMNAAVESLPEELSVGSTVTLGARR